MSITDQVDALQQKAENLKCSFDQSMKETHEQVEERLSKTKADIAARQNAVKSQAEHAAEHTQNQWQAMKADAAAKMQAAHDRMDRRRDERDVKKAERDAEDAEDDAADALDFAAWALDQAQLAVLGAVDARTWADACASAQPAHS
jgi:hypothetical protein